MGNKETRLSPWRVSERTLIIACLGDRSGQARSAPARLGAGGLKAVARGRNVVSGRRNAPVQIEVDSKGIGFERRRTHLSLRGSEKQNGRVNRCGFGVFDLAECSGMSFCRQRAVSVKKESRIRGCGLHDFQSSSTRGRYWLDAAVPLRKPALAPMPVSWVSISPARSSTPPETTAMTARPRPTIAAVSTTQSTVTAPDSDFAKFLIIAVIVQSPVRTLQYHLGCVGPYMCRSLADR